MADKFNYTYTAPTESERREIEEIRRQWALYGWGIAVSAVGAAALGASYPLYKFVLKRNKKRFGQEIIELSDELLKME